MRSGLELPSSTGPPAGRKYTMKTPAIAAFIASAIALGVCVNAADAQSAAPSQTYEQFVSGDYLFAPTADNQFAPNTSQEGPSYAGRAVGEFPVESWSAMLEVNAEQLAYPHPAGFVTTIGRSGSSFVPAFTAQDRDLDVRLGVGLLPKYRVYLGGSYIWMNNNYGYPQLTGAGFGIEKLPDLDRSLSAFGDYYYYPQLQGTYLSPTLGSQTLAYHYSKYEAGLAYSFPLGSMSVRPFVEAGWRGTYGWAGTNAPSNRHVEGPFLGIGLKL